MPYLILILCLVASFSLRASTVTLSSASDGPGVFNAANSVKVPNGCLVRVGMVTETSNPAGTFVEFGISTVKSGGFGPSTVPGKLNGSVTISEAESTHHIFNGREIYIWIYNAPTAATATEQGLFHTSRVFPVNNEAAPDDTVTIQSSVHITGVAAVPGFTTAQILAGDATDTKHLVLGSALVLPTDTDADGQPDAWETANGLNPGNAGDAVLDADGDTINNRLEYALGSDPRSRVTPAPAETGKLNMGGTEYATFRFTRRKNLAGTTLIPELSTTLNAADWQGGAALTTVSVTDDGANETVVLRDTAPLSSRRRLFFRLRLSGL